MGQPVYKFLEEFPSDGRELALGSVQLLRRPAEPPAHEAAQTIQKIAEAYAKGFEEGQLSEQSRARTELEAVAKSFQEKLEVTAGVFSERLAEELSGKLGRQIDALHNTIADQIAIALSPFLQEALAQAAIRELVDGLRAVLHDKEATKVEIRGPQEMIDRVWQKFTEQERLQQGEHTEVLFIVDESADIKIRVNDSVIVSQLGSWIERIKEVLA